LLNIISEDKYRAQAQLRNFKACGSSATEEGWGRSGVGTQQNTIHAYTTEILSFTTRTRDLKNIGLAGVGQSQKGRYLLFCLICRN
jgi:hypothetical protein